MAEVPSAGEGAQGILARTVDFAAHLRLNGFQVGPRETEAALALIRRNALDRAQVQQGIKSLLTGRREEWERFDGLFEAFWFGRGRVRESQRQAGAMESSRRLPAIWDRQGNGEDGRGRADLRQAGAEAEAGDAEGTRPSGGLLASKQEALAKTDLRYIVDPDEIAAAEALAYRLALALRARLSRRYKVAARGRRLDFRRTIRANLGHGGAPFELRRRVKPLRPLRIVVFLDVSGSMKAYSRFFLQFVKGLVCTWVDADAYLMHSRLVRVRDALRDKDALQAMTRLSLLAEGFGGGTKLGEAFRNFNDHYAKSALQKRAVVLVLSDGYDTGAPEELARELARLKRRARRLVWLNPLLGWQDYQPVTAAMAAALPQIDHFAAANSLESLAALEPELARL